MATIEETLAGKSDAELEQLLSRLSDDLELQRAEVGLPVDETPQQIAAKRGQGVVMPKDTEAGMGMETAAEGVAETEMPKEGEGAEMEGAEVEMEVSPEGDITKETETEVAGAPRVQAKLVEFGLPDKAAEKMAKLYSEAMGGEDAAMAELEGPDYKSTKDMGRLSNMFGTSYERKTGRNPTQDRIEAMMPPGLMG